MRSKENGPTKIELLVSRLSTYYSSNITQDDIILVQELMDSKKLSPYNTRLFKHSEGKYELRLASLESGPFNEATDDPTLACLGVNTHKSCEVWYQGTDSGTLSDKPDFRHFCPPKILSTENFVRWNILLAEIQKKVCTIKAYQNNI